MLGVQLTEKAPVEKASVIVIFPQDRPTENHISECMARELFDDFTGSISRNIEEKSELMAARDENLRSPVPAIASERIREMFQKPE